MSEKNENKGVPDVECTSVGPSAASPQAITPSGLSAPVPDAPAHSPLPWKVVAPYESEVQTIDDQTIASCWYGACEGQTINVTGVVNCSEEESTANAKFIIEATSAYYPSREIIEKLDKHVSALISEIERACRSGDGLLNIPTVAADCLPFLTEARAFLNKNVKP